MPCSMGAMPYFMGAMPSSMGATPGCMDIMSNSMGTMPKHTNTHTHTKKEAFQRKTPADTQGTGTGQLSFSSGHQEQ